MDHTKIPVVLTIAGSDSGGGAGIQADLKTISLLGGYGASVITALTAQNTCGVFGIEPVSAEFVGKQLEAVLDDLPIDSLKTGMLFSKDIIEKVAEILEQKGLPLVVDPVCVSQSGHKLLQDEAVLSLKQRLFPLATIVTPNLPETEVFTGILPQNKDDFFRAAEVFFASGSKAVLIKGGHSQDAEVRDFLFLASGERLEFCSPRLKTTNNHGTGCTLSAAIATFLGLGFSLAESVCRAREFLLLALRAAYPLGKGNGPVNHLAGWLKEQARKNVLNELKILRKELRSIKNFYRLIPEVRSNIVCALPFAQSYGDVAGFDGRISATRDGELIFGEIAFEASSHVARILLTARKFDPSLTWAAALRYEENILKAIEDLGHKIFWFDRKDEPKTIKEKEGSTLEWGIAQVFENNPGQKIHFIADPGEKGKEPIIRLLAPNRRKLIAWLKDISCFCY
ncbi:MAG: bifunctional hydroxymethylpyrimidine kinase/phosphomethylpyrimidine kinase [Desulfonauticus sp.]|nr:bifunctional hydroxymethylpyrimidine kinase/phosphomethylpyrimidine kinase [Desulfonauticus sp.]